MARTCGVDAHRDFCQATVREAGRIIERLRFATDPGSLVEFAQRLQPGDHVVLESTSFAWPIAEGLLRREGVKVTVTNPAKTKAIAYAKVKSDKVDADMLAMLGEADLLAEVWIPDAATLELRRFVCARQRLVNLRTGARRNANAILQRNLIKPPMTDAFGKRGREWLGSLLLDPHERILMDTYLAVHDALQTQIVVIERQIGERCVNRGDVKLLVSIPGIGIHTAAGLAATIGRIDRFSSPGKLVSYLGLDSKSRQSGNTAARGGRISKQGSVVTRALLVEAAGSAIRTPGPLRAFFNRVKKRSGYQKAIVAVARKLTVVAWHMLRNGETYRYELHSLTLKKFGELERAAGQTPQRRGAYSNRHSGERALLEQAERLYEQQQRARASQSERDSTMLSATGSQFHT